MRFKHSLQVLRSWGISPMLIYWTRSLAVSRNVGGEYLYAPNTETLY